MDEAFNELKEDLGESQNLTDEEIIHAMIENYQTKIDLLGKVLMRLKQNRTSEIIETEQNIEM